MSKKTNNETEVQSLYLKAALSLSSARKDIHVAKLRFIKESLQSLDANAIDIIYETAKQKKHWTRTRE
tara:strand:+ start:639 stop:842 length:204 start_codon:yes stop_codon:yes gene_type:complete